jgi:hypothetical protein
MNGCTGRVVASLAVVVCAGCARELPPSMSLAAAVPAPPDASLVFVRPISPCDASDYTVVVDSEGHFVGNLGPGMQLAVPAAEGTHVYYAWSSHDFRVEREPNFNPVSAVRLNVRPGGPQYVTLIVKTRTAYVSRCEPWAIVDLHPVAPSGPRHDEAEQWVREGRWVSPDLRAGQASLDATPAKITSFLELGREKMRGMDEDRLRALRQRSERAEDGR